MGNRDSAEMKEAAGSPFQFPAQSFSSTTSTFHPCQTKAGLTTLSIRSFAVASRRRSESLLFEQNVSEGTTEWIILILPRGKQKRFRCSSTPSREVASNRYNPRPTVFLRLLLLFLCLCFVLRSEISFALQYSPRSCCAISFHASVHRQC